MNINVAPSFETLERLGRGPDRDLIGFKPPDRAGIRGRGAQSNRSGRFEKTRREDFDDGWELEEPQKKFETVEHVERAGSIISRNSSPDLHFDRSINPYRGCAHGCSYCYARPSHAYLGHSAGLDFERDIHIKPDAARLLKRELSRPRYRARPIAIGTNTDPYQPLERKHGIMRQLLEVFCQARHPLMITTKSALVTRDLDLLKELGRQNLVFVTISITTMDHKLSRWMEPRASAPARRLEAIRALSDAGIATGVLFAPVIPAINDMELERIMENSAAQGAESAGMIMLRLPGEVKDIFREWLLRYFPNRVSHVMNLVRDVRGGRENDPRFGWRMGGQGPYAQMLKQRLDLITEKLALNKAPSPLNCDLFEAPEKMPEQLNLF